jgi:hypothetical protein
MWDRTKIEMRQKKEVLQHKEEHKGKTKKKEKKSKIHMG